VGNAPIVIGRNVSTIKVDRVIKILKSEIVFIVVTIVDRTVTIKTSVLRIALDLFRPRRNRFVKFFFLGDGFVKQFSGFGDLFDFGFGGLYFQDLGVIRNRLVIGPLKSFDICPAQIRFRINEDQY